MNIKQVFLISLIFIAFAIPVYAVEDIRESDTGLEYEQILEIIESGTPTNPNLLNELSKQDNILAVYGTIPKKDSKEAYEWWLALDKVAESLAKDKEFIEYEYIEGIGADTDGYIYIQILEKNKDLIKSQELETIKKYVDKHSEMQNIENIPLAIKIVKPARAFETNPNSGVSNPIERIQIITVFLNEKYIIYHLQKLISLF
jgi:hypothetical protein